jgi:hypothetical protein
MTRLARHVRAVLMPGLASLSSSTWGEGAGGGQDVGGPACVAYGTRLEHNRSDLHTMITPQSPSSLSYRQCRDTSQKRRESPHGDAECHGEFCGKAHAIVHGLYGKASGLCSRRVCRHAILGMTVIAAEESAWTYAVAWGSVMRRMQPPREPTEASFAGAISVARGCNGLCKTLALGGAARRISSAARDTVAAIVAPLTSDLAVDGTHRPRVEDSTTDASASRPRMQGRVTRQASREEERDADRRFTNTPLGKC